MHTSISNFNVILSLWFALEGIHHGFTITYDVITRLWLVNCSLSGVNCWFQSVTSAHPHKRHHNDPQVVPWCQEHIADSLLDDRIVR